MVGEGQNPEADADMAEYAFSFERVYMNNGDVIQIESNTHYNGKIHEGDGHAYARGRWRSIAFQCAEGE